jgi:FAD/FMN-containing dehydrogenase
MRDVTRHDAFVAKGCAGPGVPAVSVGAGTRWIEAYHAVTSVGGRYVQGGGCTSVGAAGGFLQGGGFGSWSKKFGIAAASLLEAEVVTADGKIRVASACQNSDLFWALRGGGGGTFGVVTRATLRTHPLPSYFGFALGTIQAKSDRAFEELLRRFVHFYRDALDNERWGEQVRVRSDDALDVRMSFQGLTAEAAEQVWKPLREWIASRTDLTVELHFAAIPGRQAWDEETIEKRFPGVTTPDPDGRSERFWWSGNQGEVATYWWAYQSRWLPIDLFDDAHAAGLAHTLFAASRHWPLELHFNKGQSGASAEALARDRETSVNPVVLRSAALVIVAANGAGSPEVPGKTPDRKEGERSRAGVSAAMKILRDATPGSGSYVNETDYFEPDWQRSFWGDGYPRLLSVKHTYDPDGLFTCHHCVGSEEKAKTR